MEIRLLILYLILLFNKGLLFLLGVPEISTDILCIGLVLLAFLSQLSKGNIKYPPGLIWVLFYVTSLLVSTFYHDNNSFTSIMQSRYLIIGYLIFLIIYNYDFKIKTFNKLRKTLVLIFIIQIIATIIKFLIIGQVEAVVGTMTQLGGGLATTFAMFVFVLFFTLWLSTGKNKYVFFAFLSLVISYSSGKLGVYFFTPLLIIISIIVSNRVNKINWIFNKKILFFILGIPILLGVFLVIIDGVSHRTRNIQGDWNEKLLQFSEYTFESELVNSSSIRGDSYTTSRFMTSQRIIDETFKRDLSVFFFGQGFAVREQISGQIDGTTFEDYKIVYGVVGWAWDALYFGWPSMFFHVMFYISLLKAIKKNKFYKYVTNSKVLRFLMVVNISIFYLYIINYFFYNSSYTVGGWVLSLHVLLYGFLLSPSISSILIYKYEKYFR